jgi:hypothetical protein
MSPRLDSKPTDAHTPNRGDDASTPLRVALVCASRHHGNTQGLAEAMASASYAIVFRTPLGDCACVIWFP